jgi:hypothetical protein
VLQKNVRVAENARDGRECGPVPPFASEVGFDGIDVVEAALEEEVA